MKMNLGFDYPSQAMTFARLTIPKPRILGQQFVDWPAVYLRHTFKLDIQVRDKCA